VVRLTPLRLALVGTVLEATVFLLEVPTRVVADVYGRRRGRGANALSIRAAIALAGLILWPAFWLYRHAPRGESAAGVAPSGRKVDPTAARPADRREGGEPRCSSR
jgi:hypothetical protein